MINTASQAVGSRRWLRLSVRGLMLAVFIVALILGQKVNRANRQARAVAAVEASGGSVMFDYQWVNGKLVRGGKIGGPKWLRRILGDEYFREVTYVAWMRQKPDDSEPPFQVTDDHFAAIEAFDRLEMLTVENAPLLTDEALRNLSGLSRLHSLTLRNLNVTDAGVYHIKGLIDLENLRISYSKITDVGLSHLNKLTKLERLWLAANPGIRGPGLAHLRHMSNLQFLGLAGTTVDDESLLHMLLLPALDELILPETVTDAGLANLADLTSLRHLILCSTAHTRTGMAHLKRWTSLEGLSVSGPGITDDALKEIAGLRSLRSLSLYDTPVTDAGLAHLKSLKDLQLFNISETQVTDAGLVYVASFGHLEYLNLCDTTITDAGLERLTGLKKLTQLHADNTGVTDAGIRKLKAALPTLSRVTSVQR